MSNKLDGFPHVYYINMDSNVERNRHVQEHLASYGIGSFERSPGVVSDYSELLKYINSDLYIEWARINHVPAAALACTIAHLLAIKRFAESDHDVAVICEDDIDLTLTKYWNFTWNEMYNLLPEDWQTVQLSRTYMDQLIMNMCQLGIRRWGFNEYSAIAYMMKKQCAMEITDFYFTQGNLLKAVIKGSPKPIADGVVYAFSKEGVYSLNLMYSNNGKISSSNIHVNHEPMVQDAMNILEKAWQNNKLTIEQIMELK